MIESYASTAYRHSLLQCLDGFLCDLFRLAHHLTPDFAHLLQLTLCSDEGIGVVTGPELADARHHKHAFGVVLIGAGTGGEDGGLELLEVLWWSEEDELVARGGRRCHVGRMLMFGGVRLSV
jgi:hypothetical protein